MVVYAGKRKEAYVYRSPVDIVSAGQLSHVPWETLSQQGHISEWSQRSAGGRTRRFWRRHWYRRHGRLLWLWWGWSEIEVLLHQVPVLYRTVNDCQISLVKNSDYTFISCFEYFRSRTRKELWLIRWKTTPLSSRSVACHTMPVPLICAGSSRTAK